MDKETELKLHFLTESGKNEAERQAQDCLDALVPLLHEKFVQVNGKQYKMRVIGQDGKIMFDILDLPGFDHMEFCVRQTGWGRNV